MALLAFDTHKFITSLTAAGMAPKQAEVLAQTYASVLTEQVATKADIETLRTEMKARFEAVNARFEAVDASFETLEHRLEAKLTKYISGGVAVIAAVLTSFEFVIR